MIQKKIHICQISKESTLLNGDKNSEPYQRQVSYYNNLVEKTGNDSRMSIIILSNSLRKKMIFFDKGLQIIGIKASIWVRFIGIFFIVYKLHKKSPITTFTTQAPIDESWTVLLFGKIFRIPTIAQIHFDIFDANAIKQTLGEGIRGKLRFLIFKKTIKYHKKIRVVGNRITKNLIDKCSCTPDQIVLIPVMVPLLNQVTEFKRVIKPLSPFRVVFVGRLVAQKNLFFLLKIAAETISIDRSVIFEIVGSGPLKKDLENECKNYKIDKNVIFYGEIANSDLPKIYNNADVFILTSYYEGFGRVIIEAGAYKLPVLSTRITGPEDIITDGYNGYLFELDDYKGFVEKIIYLKNNVQERLNMGNNNFDLVSEKYNPHSLKEQWINLLIKK